MIISFFTVSLEEKKCSEIRSTQSTQTFFANPSGLWFIQIVGAISLWLHWNPQNWTHSHCREPELLNSHLGAAMCVLSPCCWLPGHGRWHNGDLMSLEFWATVKEKRRGLLPRNAWISGCMHSIVLSSEITQICKLIFALIPNWSADYMSQAKFVSYLFWVLAVLQFWIASFSLPTSKQKKDGIHLVTSWALKKEMEKNTRRELLL